VTSTFEIEETDGLLVVHCRALGAVPGIAHAFSTARADGATRFDLGTAESADPAVLAGRERFLAAAGFEGRIAGIVRQVHGARIVRTAETADVPEADGILWTDRDAPGRVPAVRTADCVAILLVDRGGRAAAALHAGWRGTAAAIVPEAVAALRSAGVPACDLVAALGPAILACCYEVGPEVAEAIVLAVPQGDGKRAVLPGEKGKARVDLHAANRAQLVASGVPAVAVHAAPWCTRCRADLFHSHRRQGAAAGRMMACVGPAARTRPTPDP